MNLATWISALGGREIYGKALRRKLSSLLEERNWLIRQGCKYFKYHLDLQKLKLDNPILANIVENFLGQSLYIFF